MDHGTCQWIITGMGAAICAMAGAFMKILMWYKKESEGRLKDSQDLYKMLGEDNETKIK